MFRKPSPSDFDVGQFWTAANRGGNFANVNVRGIPSSCFDIISSFDNKIALRLLQTILVRRIVIQGPSSLLLAGRLTALVRIQIYSFIQ